MQICFFFAAHFGRKKTRRNAQKKRKNLQKCTKMHKNVPFCTDTCNTPAYYTPVSAPPRISRANQQKLTTIDSGLKSLHIKSLLKTTPTLTFQWFVFFIFLFFLRFSLLFCAVSSSFPRILRDRQRGKILAFFRGQTLFSFCCPKKGRIGGTTPELQGQAARCSMHACRGPC